ncbi:hypothetical protein ACFL6C_12290 [Myxococcota bacterium]
MLYGLMSLLVVAPGLVEDTPPGTDLILRLEVGKLAKEVHAGWDELEPLVNAWPAFERLLSDMEASWRGVVDVITVQTGVDLKHRNTNLTIVLDLDATGGIVWAAVARNGAKMRKGVPEEVGPKMQRLEVDGHTAYRLKDRDVAWSSIDRAVVVGNERGMQRQLRFLRKKRVDQTEPIALQARRLRKSAPVKLAFALPESTRSDLRHRLPNVGPLLAVIRSGNLSARPGVLEVRLTAGDDDGRKALEHGVRAFVALTRACVALLEGGAEAVLGLELVGERPAALPPSLDAEAIEALAKAWVKDLQVRSQVRTRRGHEVETTLEISSYRGLVAAVAVMAIMVMPTMEGGADRAEVEALLEALQRAEEEHKRSAGTYVACGPVPEKVPTAGGGGMALWHLFRRSRLQTGRQGQIPIGGRHGRRCSGAHGSRGHQPRWYPRNLGTRKGQDSTVARGS